MPDSAAWGPACSKWGIAGWSSGSGSRCSSGPRASCRCSGQRLLRWGPPLLGGHFSAPQSHGRFPDRGKNKALNVTRVERHHKQNLSPRMSSFVLALQLLKVLICAVENRGLGVALAKLTDTGHGCEDQNFREMGWVRKLAYFSQVWAPFASTFFRATQMGPSFWELPI